MHIYINIVTDLDERYIYFIYLNILGLRYDVCLSMALIPTLYLVGIDSENCCYEKVLRKNSL